MDIKRLTHSINSMINESIHIKKILKVDDKFHARFNVIKKEYVYKINMGEYNPIEKDYVFQYNKKINKVLLDEFIFKMSGIHNFKSFTSDKEKDNYQRDLTLTYKIQNNTLYLYFKSSGFLRYMIRNIVGLLLDINDGKKDISDIEKIFQSENRCSCGKCAAGCGLYLKDIYY